MGTKELDFLLYSYNPVDMATLAAMMKGFYHFVFLTHWSPFSFSSILFASELLVQ